MRADIEISFVDTNVLVYSFDKGDSPKRLMAQRLLNQLIEDDTLRLSTQVLQELFVTMTRKSAQRCSSEEALGILDDLTAWPVLVVDYAAIRSAIELANQSMISFWDALIVIAAVRSGAAVLFTEDLNHGQEILGVRIQNPFRA